VRLSAHLVRLHEAPSPNTPGLPLSSFLQVMCEACGEVVHSGGTLYSCPVGSRFQDATRGAYGPGATSGLYLLGASRCVTRQSSLQFQCVSCSHMTYGLTGGVSNGTPGNASDVVCHVCGPGSDCSAGKGKVVAAKGFWGVGE
jgi:hypothetical protein